MDMTARKFSLLGMLTLAVAVMVVVTPASAIEPCCTAGCSGCGGGGGSCSTGLRTCKDCICGCNPPGVECCCYTTTWICTHVTCGSAPVSAEVGLRLQGKSSRLVPVAAVTGPRSAVRPAQQEQGAVITNNPNYPLQIVSVTPRVSSDGTGFEGAKIRLRNTGILPCDAYEVSFTITFSDAEQRRASVREDLTPLGYAKPGPTGDQRIMPAQVHDLDATGMRVTSLAPASVTGIEARIDYILMANSQAYGEDPDHAGEELRMMRWGRKAERNRLLNVYKSGGTQALVEQLEQK